MPARTLANSAASSAAWPKNGRPVRVRIAPVAPRRVDPEAARRHPLVAAGDDDRARAHVLLLADDALDAVAAVRGEGLGRVLEHPRHLGGGRRGHRRREVDQPARVGGEAAHHLEGGSGVLLTDRHRAAEAGRHDALAEHVAHVELARLPPAAVRVAAVRVGAGPRSGSGSRAGSDRERPRRLVVHAMRWDRHELALRPAQRRQPPAVDATRVDADRLVQPDRLGNRRVPVDDGRLAAVVLRPRVAHRQPVLVGLAGRVAVEGEGAHRSRGAPLHVGAKPRMGDDEAPVVEDVVADEAVDERRDAGGELGRLGGELRQRLFQPVPDGDVAALQGAQQLDLVVARDAQRVAGLDHAHDESEHRRGGRPAVDEVAEEHGATALEVVGGGAVRGKGVAQLAEQLAQLLVAAVHVADHVEGAVIVAAVGPQPAPLDARRLDLPDPVQHDRPMEAFAPQVGEGAAELGVLVADDVRAEAALGARRVALGADGLGHVEDDGHGKDVVRLGERDERPARLGLHVGRVDHRQPAGGEALAGDVVQHVEGGRRRRLVVLVVAHECTAEVGGDHLGRREVPCREARLARPGHADEHDEGQLGQLDARHRENTASCVGWPRSGSSGPIPDSSTR